LLVAMFALACPAAKADEPAETASRCYDAVVVARLVEQEEGPWPDADSGVIILRTPWVMTFDPKEVLYAAVPVSRRSLKVGTIQHTGFRDGIPYFLVFLRLEQDGFHAQWIDTHLTQDAQGRFVRPIEDLDKEQGEAVDTFPHYWIPRDYLSLQVPVRFRTKAAWWLRFDYDPDGNLIPLSSKPKWTEEPGIRLDDLRSVFERQAKQPCPDSPYQAG
jgi:hypothetical protein